MVSIPVYSVRTLIVYVSGAVTLSYDPLTTEAVSPFGRSCDLSWTQENTCVSLTGKCEWLCKYSPRVPDGLWTGSWFCQLERFVELQRSGAARVLVAFSR